MKTTIDNLIADVKNMDDGLGGFLSLLSYPKNFGNIGMQGFYGFLIAFSFFAILGALLTACCDKPGCRHLMYFSCIFLFIGGFIAFWIAVIFSIFVPIFTWTCSFLDVTIGSDAGFRSNFDTFLSANTIDQISVCMPFGDGVIVNKVGGSATTGLNSLTTVISNLKSFNNATLQGYISGNLTALTTMINAYANGDISDLDAANNNILLGISDPTNTTNKASCTTISSGTTTKFSLDSWVPSNNQNYSYSTAISCQVSSGNTGTKVSCASSIPGACSGCMDTSQLFTLRGTKTDIQNDLIARYGAGCVFATTMGNIWQNYYDKRYTILGYPNVVGPSPAGSVKNRLSTLTTAITDTTVATSVFKSLDNFRS